MTKKDIWTRNQEFGGAGEYIDPETIEVEDSDNDDFCGFYSDEDVDVIEESSKKEVSE